jgi:ZIP family zinc transporter
MIAVGIGLHNLGEGLAVGAAILLGKIALSTFLIVGFTLHNSTEGLAIVAPIAKRSSKVRILRLIGMGIIAGAPTIAGVWIGGFLYSSLAAIIFLSIGAGAIFQVVFSLGSWLISRSGRIISKNDNNNNDDNNYYSTAPNAEKIKRSVGRNSIKTSWLSTSFITGFVAGMIIMYATSLLVLS